VRSRVSGLAHRRFRRDLPGRREPLAGVGLRIGDRHGGRAGLGRLVRHGRSLTALRTASAERPPPRHPVYSLPATTTSTLRPKRLLEQVLLLLDAVQLACRSSSLDIANRVTLPSSLTATEANAGPTPAVQPVGDSQDRREAAHDRTVGRVERDHRLVPALGQRLGVVACGWPQPPRARVA